MADLPPPDIRPLPPQAWAPSLADVAADLGAPAHIHGLIANHPALLRAWMPFRNHFVRGGGLSPRQREILVLATARATGTAYEWRHHVERGLAAGLSAEEIDAIRTGGVHPGWSEAERLLTTAAEELTGTLRLSRPTCHALRALYAPEPMLDIVFTVGAYVTLAMAIKSFEVPLEPEFGEAPAG